MTRSEAIREANEGYRVVSESLRDDMFLLTIRDAGSLADMLDVVADGLDRAGDDADVVRQLRSASHVARFWDLSWSDIDAGRAALSLSG